MGSKPEIRPNRPQRKARSELTPVRIHGCVEEHTMKSITRRNFLKGSMTTGLALGMPRIVIRAQSSSKTIGPNDTVHVAVIGLGDTTAVGGVGGRGHQLIPRLREVPGVKITALCDIDQTFLDRETQPFKDRGEAIDTFKAIRKIL